MSFLSALGMIDLTTAQRIRESRNVNRQQLMQKRARQPPKRAGRPKRPRPNGPDEEEDNDHDDACFVCDRGGEVLLCDRCDRVYHLRCLTPPLSRVPEGEWLCPVCQPVNPSLPPFDTTPFEMQFWNHEQQVYNELLRLTGQKAHLMSLLEPLTAQRNELREKAIEQTRIVSFAQTENKRLRVQLQQLHSRLYGLEEAVSQAVATIGLPSAVYTSI